MRKAGGHRQAGRRSAGGLQPQRPPLACLRSLHAQQLHGSGKLYWNGDMRRAFAAAIADDDDDSLWMNDNTRLDDGALALAVELTPLPRRRMSSGG